jgi:hypothetical protein
MMVDVIVHNRLLEGDETYPMLLKKSSGPDLYRPGEKTTRLEALYTIADDHLDI